MARRIGSDFWWEGGVLFFSFLGAMVLVIFCCRYFSYTLRTLHGLGAEGMGGGRIAGVWVGVLLQRIRLLLQGIHGWMDGWMV